MKVIFNLKRHLNFKRFLLCAFVFVLIFLITNVNNIHNALGQVYKEEPYISLNVTNKPLSDVLRKISEDTGYKFKLNDQWSSYPINASLVNMPLHQVLRRILARLNHSIIYESGKRINIVIYAEADSRGINQVPFQSISPQIQEYRQEPPPPPEPPPEKPDEPERANESPPETGASGAMEQISTETKDSAENAGKESTEQIGAEESRKSDSTGQSESSNEQNEQKKVEEDTSPANPQKQN